MGCNATDASDNFSRCVELGKECQEDANQRVSQRPLQLCVTDPVSPVPRGAGATQICGGNADLLIQTVPHPVSR